MKVMISKEETRTELHKLVDEFINNEDIHFDTKAGWMDSFIEHLCLLRLEERQANRAGLEPASKAVRT